MNTVYLISPRLTMERPNEADPFFAAAQEALEAFGNAPVLRSDTQIHAAEPKTGDAVVVFNREDQNYSQVVSRFVRRSRREGACILPVAMTGSARRPIEEAGAAQSFDFAEQLRQRAFSSAQATTLGIVFARQVQAIVKPTLITEPMHLFLSHRRLDGEDLAAGFTRLRTSSTNNTFRDLFDVRMGADAQDVIEKNLRESDAVIFLDTPRSAESPWIAKELRGALEFGLPIVWVRVGPALGRGRLEVKPAERPHFELPDLDPQTQEIPQELLEAIIHRAQEIHHRDYVERLFSEFYRLKDVAAQNEIGIRTVDASKMVFALTLDRPRSRYRQRPLTHLLQLFGRTPTALDIAAFSACAAAGGYQAHPEHGHHYDSAILLAAIPPRVEATFNESGVHTDSIADYVADVEQTLRPAKSRGRRLLISGAFPDCEPEYQQSMNAALLSVAQVSLQAGVPLSFGAHPTFQYLLFDLAKRLRPDDIRTFLRMYVSRHFLTDETATELQANAEVRPTEKVSGDQGRERSLTLMRRAMVDDPDTGALLVIGGRTSRGGHVPGIDEEIDIAKRRGIPIFIFGSVGGRSSQIAEELTTDQRVALNGLTAEQNDDLATSIDYSRLTEMILKRMG